MTSRFIEIACPPEKGRCARMEKTPPWGEGGVFPQPSEPAGSVRDVKTGMDQINKGPARAPVHVPFKCD